MSTKTNRTLRNVLLAISLTMCLLAVSLMGLGGVAKANTDPKLNNLRILGASVRVEDQNTELSGIRFEFVVDFADYNTIIDNEYTIGMAIVFADYDEYQPLFDIDALTLNSKYFTGEGTQDKDNLRYWDFSDIGLEEGIGDYTGEYVGKAAITNVKNANLTLERVAYVYVKNADGNYVQIVKGEPRSMTYVAQKAIEDPKASSYVDFLTEHYVTPEGTTSYTVEHIAVDEDGVTVKTVKETVNDATIGGTTALINETTDEAFTHYEKDTEATDNVASSVVYANGKTTLKQYYRQVRYPVTATLTANDYDGTSYGDVIVSRVNTDKTYTLTSENGVVTGNLPAGTYTARVNGYKDVTEQFVVDGEETNLFTLAPGTFEYSNNGFNDTTIEYGKTALMTGSSSQLNKWYVGEYKNARFIQSSGRAQEVYYEDFCETEYTIGAYFSGRTSPYDDTSWGANDFGAMNGGISIRASETKVIHLYYTTNYGFWIAFGALNANASANNVIRYSFDKSVDGKTFAETYTNDSTDARQGVYLSATRKDNVLTVYVDGVKSFTLDATNGIQKYGYYENSTIQYNYQNTTITEFEDINVNEYIASVLATGVGNYIGYNAPVPYSIAGDKYNAAIITSPYRANKADYLYYEKMYTTTGNVALNDTTTKVSNSTTANAYDALKVSKAAPSSMSNKAYYWIHDENKMYMLGQAIGTSNTSPISIAKYFTNTIRGSFVYEATFDVQNGLPALAITDGTDKIYFSLGTASSYQRLFAVTTVDGVDKVCYTASDANLSATAVKRVLRLEIDLVNSQIKVYTKELDVEGKEFTLVGTVDASTANVNGWDYGAAGAENQAFTTSAYNIINSLKAGKSVACGAGSTAGPSGWVGATLTNFKITSIR